MNDAGATSGNQTVIVGSLDGNGTITDGSTVGAITTLDVAMYGSSPCLFAGQIEDGENENVRLQLDGEGRLTLTGNNTYYVSSTEYPTYTGGTEIDDGWLQIGDGQTTGSMIGGVVADDTTGGLTFDVAAGDAPTFNGVIYTGPLIYPKGGEYGDGDGSVVKAGAGTLEMTFAPGTSGRSSFGYTGELRVEAGTLTLGDSTVLPSGASLTVENSGTRLDLNNKSFAAAHVTLNGGSIVNGTIVASGSYDVSSGTISANLEGTPL